MSGKAGHPHALASTPSGGGAGSVPLLPTSVPPPLTSSSALQPTLKRRRTLTTVACRTCRTRHSRCNGQRPCNHCKAQSVICEYDVHDGETRKSALQRKYDALREENERYKEALSALQQRLLAVTDNPLAILAAFDSNPTSLLSEHATARSILPPTSSRLEYELAVTYSLAYPAILPIDPCLLQRLSEIPDLAPTPSQHQQILSSTALEPLTATIFDNASLPDSRSASSLHLSPLYGPDRPLVTLCDERLHRITARYWTSVPISDILVAQLLSLYLEYEHPTTGFFDADLFLNDLVEHEHNFCSSLLLDSVLFQACQAVSMTFPEAADLKFRFFGEARRLWEVEKNKATLCTVAAAHLLVFSVACCGMDELSNEIATDAYKLAESLGLFSRDRQTTDSVSPHDIRASGHVAWGAYSSLTLRALFYRSRLPPNAPPYAVPGHEDHSLNRTRTTDTCVTRITATFSHICRFWRIIYDIVVLYYHRSDKQTPLFEQVPLAFAESRYHGLLSWVDSLPTASSLGLSEEQHAFTFHVWFHSAVMDIFRPFLASDDRPRTLAYPESTPLDIYQSSLRQMQHLGVVHRQRRNPVYNQMWQSTVISMHLANAMLDSTVVGRRNGTSSVQQQQQQLRYFMLSMRLQWDQCQCLIVSRAFLQGFLTMAVRQNFISVAEARRIMQSAPRLALGTDHYDPDWGIDAYSAGYILDQHAADTGRDEEGRVVALKVKFDELTLFEDMTAGNDFKV